jgi:DNA mismatch repair ATPase MutL
VSNSEDVARDDRAGDGGGDSDQAHYSTSGNNSSDKIDGGVLKCVGFVSKPREGVGRSDSDRQYVFCNGRPVDLPRVHRLFNEVQHCMQRPPPPKHHVPV